MKSTHRGLNDLGSGSAGESLHLCGQPEAGTKVKPLAGWIGPVNLFFTLTGQGQWQKEYYAQNDPPFIKREYQPGLAIEPGTSGARYGMLYFLNSLRFERDSGLMGILQGNLDERLSSAALESATGSAGRKGRVVRFLRLERFHPDWKKLMEGTHLSVEVAKDNATFWLLTLTPVRLREPYMPELHITLPPSVQCQILAALTGRPVSIGGYQMATGKSRPNRLYVPAGSAWLFRLTGGTPEDRAGLLHQLNNTHLLGPREEAAFGFGHTLVGLVVP